MRALVTGGSGHLGYTLASLLVARGHDVAVTVRALAETRQTERLGALGVAIFEADVRREAQVHAALDGVDVLFHAAAVYSIADRGRDQEMLDTAIAGTEATLRAAAARGVRRVVMTSSVAALPLTRPGAPPSTEAAWNDDLRVPYFRAKVESERRAWVLASELGLDLVAILPASMIGPGFLRPTYTIDLIRAVLLGEFRLGAPRGTLALVDVRDAAHAHVLAAERRASGRFMVGYDHIPTYDELVRAIARLDPRVKPPLTVLPGFVAPLLPLYDALSHRLLGTPRIATHEVIAATTGDRVFNYSTDRARRELGWAPAIPFEQSLRDTLAWLRTTGGAAGA